MSRIFTVREIVDRALRKIGAYSIRDQGADGEEVTESLMWLDMIVADRFSQQRTHMVVPSTITMALTTGVDTYVLDQVLGTAAGGGVEYVANIALVMNNGGSGEPLPAGDQDGLPRCSGGAADAGPDRAALHGAGRPQRAGDPEDRAEAAVHDAGDVVARVLVIQQIPMDFTLADEERAMRMRSCFNLWAVKALAAEIGDGPVRRLPQEETRLWKAEADAHWADLLAMDMQENTSAPPAPSTTTSRRPDHGLHPHLDRRFRRQQPGLHRGQGDGLRGGRPWLGDGDAGNPLRQPDRRRDAGEPAVPGQLREVAAAGLLRSGHRAAG